jgi:flagellar biosynthetic protein FliR
MLSQFLPAEIFGFLLVFSRLGAMVMLFPALGETAIPSVMRLALALMLSLIIYTLVRTSLPVMPNNAIQLALLLCGEIVMGLFIGGSIKLLMSSLHVAGTIIGFQTGLSAAQAFDPAQSSQSAILGTFMMLVGVTMIFVTDLHHVMIAAMRDSYILFPAGKLPPTDDFARLVIRTVADSFKLGVQIGAPFLVYGLMFNIGLGLLSRLMPQLQVFFIAMPLGILMGFTIFFFVLSAIMFWFIQYIQASLLHFVV